jgi:NAD(P)-dependent dehydrogenase (short-subunit alcohol dehydrogenase family)
MPRTALITGASSGIGAAAAEALAAAGFSLCLTARRRDRLREVAGRINAAAGEGERAVVSVGDVTREADRRRALEALLGRWGRIDVLVNNAGYGLPGAVEELDLQAVREQFEVNTFAYLAWMQLAGRTMREAHRGRIINVSSVSGLFAFPALGAYAASKFAVEALSDAARREWRPFGVKVILVEPGSVVSEIWQRGRDAAGPHDRSQSPFRRLYEQMEEHTRDLASGKGRPAAVVARAIRRAATSRRPRARYRVGGDAFAAAAMAHLPTCVQDYLVSRALEAGGGQ